MTNLWKGFILFGIEKGAFNDRLGIPFSVSDRGLVLG